MIFRNSPSDNDIATDKPPICRAQRSAEEAPPLYTDVSFISEEHPVQEETIYNKLNPQLMTVNRGDPDRWRTYRPEETSKPPIIEQLSASEINRGKELQNSARKYLKLNGDDTEDSTDGGSCGKQKIVSESQQNRELGTQIESNDQDLELRQAGESRM